MTPKEKAKKLFNKFHKYIYSEENIKECALIAVNEIIESRKEDNRFNDTLLSTGSDYYTMHPMFLKYWLEVKKEIKLL